MKEIKKGDVLCFKEMNQIMLRMQRLVILFNTFKIWNI